MRSNAACVGKARLRSCMGRFAGAWLVVCPTSPALEFDDCDLLCAMRLRVGMAIKFEGGDLHGHTALAVSTGGGINARHSVVINAWRQVFIEAGGSVPDRRVEQLLSDTHVRVLPYDMRRMDIVVPGLNVDRGLPLFCDVTVHSPITRLGAARPGTSNRGGSLLEAARAENDDTYRTVVDSGIASLKCLGHEVFGRWGDTCIQLLPKLALERTRGLHIRIRRGIALCLQRRWCGLIGISVQKAVAHQVLRFENGGVDLYETRLEEPTFIADLGAL